MADEWQPVAGAKPPEDQWQPVGQQVSTGVTGFLAGLPTQLRSQVLGPVADAFGQGFKEGFGEDRLNLSPEQRQIIRNGAIEPLRSFNELFYDTLFTYGGLAIRGSTGLFRGTQAALIEAGVPRDIAAIPEAFMGMHGLGIPKPEPSIPAKMPPEVPPVAKEAPIVQFRRDAAAIEQSLPPVEEGFTRLWRGNRPGEVGEATGFSDSLPGIALPFRKAYRGDLSYVDVPTGDLPKYTNVAGVAEGEFNLPSEIAKEAKIISETPVPDLAQAHDLGVIGDEKPSVNDGKPREAARQTTMAAERPDEKIAGPEPTGNPWRERFEQFVGKVKTDDDIKQLIRDAADENEEFPLARQGQIPLKQVEYLAEAAGVDPTTVNRDGIGRLLQNDNQVRNAMHAMLAATEQVKAAAREVKADASPENLMKLQEGMLRRDRWVEQVVGHRAEWGRTGNVFQEFLERVKDEQSFTEFLKDKDRSPDGLKKIADAVDSLDRGQASKLLSDANKPGFFDKLMYYWVNALISGPITHTKYVIANTAFGLYESAVVTPIAGAVGSVRQLSGASDRVYMGEAAYRLWGMVAGTPDALVAAAKAAKTGMQTPLPGELAQGIVPKQQQSVYFQQRPIPGWLGTAIGIPSRGASGIHSFFNFLGYRASMEAQAYRAAAKEASPVSQDFWEARQRAVDNPTIEMMNSGIEEGYRLTYLSELGAAGKAFTRALNVRVPLPGGAGIRPLRFVIPFSHIPLNILSRALEGTPISALGERTFNDLAGRNGGVKQDMAIARMVAGTAVGTMVASWVATDRVTGFGPTDPKERAQWLATGHQPYSIRIGSSWYSFNRFGSIGTMLGLYANLGEVMPHLKPDAEELTKGIAMTVHATGRLMEDEVGMQGLAGLVEAIDEPDRKGTRFVSNFAGSWLPYSSALRQTASAMDPEMRDAKTVVDGLRYYIPGLRSGLMPKRDFLGDPIVNPSYGGTPIQTRPAIASPVAKEMQALDIHPAPPKNMIGGIQLPPKLYDEFQVRAGVYAHTVLENWVRQPGWYDMPVGVREKLFQDSIAEAHAAAAADMQVKYPSIIWQGTDNRIGRIEGAKPAKRLKETVP